MSNVNKYFVMVPFDGDMEECEVCPRVGWMFLIKSAFARWTLRFVFLGIIFSNIETGGAQNAYNAQSEMERSNVNYKTEY